MSARQDIDRLTREHAERTDKLARQQDEERRKLVEQLAKVDGVDVDRDEDGNVTVIRMPPATPEGKLADGQVADYEPKFARDGFTRRVLGHITDEEHLDRGPRNTLDALALELAEDENAPQVKVENLDAARDKTAESLRELTRAGLVSQRKDHSYGLTQAGRVELAN